MISYEQDLYAWTLDNVALLREKRFHEIDIDNIIEELEGMANRDKRELFSRLEVLLIHLLKWQFQSARRSCSWEQTIAEQRRQLYYLLTGSPSLNYKLSERFSEIYTKAVKGASRETKLSIKFFPIPCPYPLEQILDEDFYPESEVSV